MISNPPIPTDRASLIAALEQAGSTVRGAKCNCPSPGHDDRNPSASLYESDGHWRVKCHSCGYLGDAADVQAAIEGRPVAQVLQTARQSCDSRKKRSIAATYDYTTADGTLLYQVCRYEPKDFRQRKPDGKGGWTWELNGTPRVLYRLPDLAGAGPESFVFIVEGEKDADRMGRLGMIATTTAGGAGKGHLADLGPLSNRHVVIVPDNDEPGRKHAQAMAEALDGKAATVRILELPDISKKGDVSDWLNCHNDDVEGLVRLAENAPEWAPEASEADSGLVIRKAADVQERPVTWFWRDKLVGGAINLLLGMPDVGKSVLTCDLAARKTTGMPWPLGNDPANPSGSVAIMAVEDSPETTIVPRLRAAGADLDRVHLIEGVHRDGVRDGFDIAKDIGRLDALRRRCPDLSLVIIDPLDSYIGTEVDTRSGNKVRQALWPLKDWADATGVTVLIVHHLNKSASTTPLDRVSGSRSFGALPRSVWMVGREDAENRASRSIMLPLKLNLCPNPEAVGYLIQSSPQAPEIPVVKWSPDPVNQTATGMLGGPPKAVDEAAQFLRETLADGPKPTAELQQLAEEAGHSWPTVKKAKERAGVKSKSEHDSQTKQISGWIWQLKQGVQDQEPLGPLGPLGPVGEGI